MILTKDSARKISQLLCAKHHKAMQDALKAFETYITSEYEKNIPADVLKVFKKHKDWFRTQSYIQLMGNGFNYENVNINKSLPEYKTRYMQPDKDVAAEAKALQNKFKDLKKYYDDLVAEVEIALLTLRTFKKITERFPEATPYLPKAESRELIVNFDNVRNKLKAV